MGQKVCIHKSDGTPVEEGSLIEFKRESSSHWGVYVGGDEIVHLTGVDDGPIQSGSQHSFTIGGQRFNKAVVAKDSIWKVAEGKAPFVHNKDNWHTQPRPKRKIVSVALSKIGEEGYNLLERNCEHFAMFCRYGERKYREGRSDQVQAELVFFCIVFVICIGLGASYSTALILSITFLCVAIRVKSKRMGILVYKSDGTPVEEGSLIEFKRGWYSHWAVYVGGEEVVHLTGVDKGPIQSGSQHSFTISGQRFNEAIVAKDSIWKVAEGKAPFVNNKDDWHTQPRPNREIVIVALSKIGKAEYNLLERNCEHFAMFCRYGEGRSDQVQAVLVYIIFAIGRVAWSFV